MTARSGGQRPKDQPALCPTDDDAIKLKLKPDQPLDKKSLDYILRTGLAGGLAGCAVRLTNISYFFFLDVFLYIC
jgi:hypothetical protein